MSFELLTPSDAAYLTTLVEAKSTLWHKLQAIAESRVAALPTGDFGIELSADGNRLTLAPRPAIYIKRGTQWERSE